MGLPEVRDRFFKKFPDAEVLDKALRARSNPTPSFFLAAIEHDLDLKASGVVLLRLGEDLERQFGINGEVAAFFTPWGDFQRRSFNAIAQRTGELVRDLQLASTGVERFTPSKRVALLVSRDPAVRAKLDEWQSDSGSELTIVPLSSSATSGAGLLADLVSSLRERLGERDLYRTQNPVSGLDFFGRASLLRNLTAAIDGDQNVAILGLRRSGKTSVLRQLRTTLLPKQIIMPIADFQMLEERSVEDLAISIASSLNDELKRANQQGGSRVWIGNESEQTVHDITPVTLSDRLKRVAARNPSTRIAIAVDEIESAAALARRNPEKVRVLLGALRSAAQANNNVSLVFSGVANRMFRSSSLDDAKTIDNPIFGQVSSYYLRPFEYDDTAKLLRELGRPMLFDWTDDAVGQVHSLTGGFPYFVRDLASTVRTSMRSKSAEGAEQIRVGADDVNSSASTWAPLAAEAWAGIVEALGNHYPSAAALLDEVLTEQELGEWAATDADARMAAEDLVELGLFERDGTSVRRSDTLAALQRLTGLHMGPSAVSRARSGDADDLGELIKRGESQTLEFKETSRIDTRTGEKGSHIEDAIVKTVAAFMNADGGQLLVGVADDGSTKGIGPDLALFGASVDRYERWIRGDLLAKRIDKLFVVDNVDTRIATYHGKQVLRVLVRSSSQVAWVDDETVYRRLGNQTVPVRGRELQAFISQRLGNKRGGELGQSHGDDGQ